MQMEVLIAFNTQEIYVNKERLSFSFTGEHLKNLSDGVDANQIDEIWWNVSGQNCIRIKNSNSAIFFDEDKYDDYVQPYVDLWQAEKDRIDQEKEEAEAEHNKFENRQARALVQLNKNLEAVKERAHIKSSLGFEVDANQTANENVNGLLITIGDGETVQFCDYYNEFHELNKSDLETLQTEIIENAQNLYAQKWQYRTAIEICTNNEELDIAVENIEFTYMDFTPAEEA